MLYYASYYIFGIFFFWLLYTAGLMIAHRSIFFPTKTIEKTPQNHNLNYEEINFASEDGVKLHGWYIEHPEPIATVLFFHGNAGNISHRLEELTLWHYINVSVFIIDYRGYGKSQGSPTENGLYRDAKAAYKYLVSEKQIDPKKIVCFGRSLGGAVAIKLANEAPLGAIIVSSTFTSIIDMIHLLFPRWIARILSFLSPVRFPSLQIIDQINCPILLLHGDQDKLIPYTMGKTLYNKATNPKMWYNFPGAGHNDVFVKGGKKYWYLVKAFIAKNIQKMDISEMKL